MRRPVERAVERRVPRGASQDPAPIAFAKDSNHLGRTPSRLTDAGAASSLTMRTYFLKRPLTPRRSSSRPARTALACQRQAGPAFVGPPTPRAALADQSFALPLARVRA